jgi:hypothetical protein
MAATPPSANRTRQATHTRWVRRQPPRRSRPEARLLAAGVTLVLVAALGPRALADDTDILVSIAPPVEPLPPAAPADDAGADGNGDTAAVTPKQEWTLWLEARVLDTNGDAEGDTPPRGPVQPSQDSGGENVTADPLDEAAQDQWPDASHGCGAPGGCPNGLSNHDGLAAAAMTGGGGSPDDQPLRNPPQPPSDPRSSAEDDEARARLERERVERVRPVWEAREVRGRDPREVPGGELLIAADVAREVGLSRYEARHALNYLRLRAFVQPEWEARGELLDPAQLARDLDASPSQVGRILRDLRQEGQSAMSKVEGTEVLATPPTKGRTLQIPALPPTVGDESVARGPAGFAANETTVAGAGPAGFDKTELDTAIPAMVVPPTPGFSPPPAILHLTESPRNPPDVHRLSGYTTPPVDKRPSTRGQAVTQETSDTWERAIEAGHTVRKAFTWVTILGGAGYAAFLALEAALGGLAGLVPAEVLEKLPTTAPGSTPG